MTAYRRGADFERMVAERLRADGWTTFRVAGSRGPADLVAVRENWGHAQVVLIQCKRNGRARPADRLALTEAAHAIRATPLLAVRRKVEGRYAPWFLPAAGAGTGGELIP